MPATNPLYVVDPPAVLNTNTTALALYNAKSPIVEVAPTALRTIDVTNAPSSMAFTVVKSNTVAAGIAVTGTGWSGGGTLFGSDLAVTGSWLVRLDKPNKKILYTPVS